MTRPEETMDDVVEEWCPLCAGPGTEMGTLGHQVHFRCRNCGAKWTIEDEPREENE